MAMLTRDSFKRFCRNMLVVFVSVFIILGAFRLGNAGSLTPSSAPAATMHSLQEQYDALVGTFNSSTITGSKNGDAFQVTKCIILKVTGGTPCS